MLEHFVSLTRYNSTGQAGTVVSRLLGGKQQRTDQRRPVAAGMFTSNVRLRRTSTISRGYATKVFADAEKRYVHRDSVCGQRWRSAVETLLAPTQQRWGQLQRPTSNQPSTAGVITAADLPAATMTSLEHGKAAGDKRTRCGDATYPSSLWSSSWT